jgi:hypothetical protein
MDYELLHEDDKTYRLKHPKGYEITIAKQAVSDAIHQKVRGYAKGGKVAPAALAPNEDVGGDDMLNTLLSPSEPSLEEQELGRKQELYNLRAPNFGNLPTTGGVMPGLDDDPSKYFSQTGAPPEKFQPGAAEMATRDLEIEKAKQSMQAEKQLAQAEKLGEANQLRQSFGVPSIPGAATQVITPQGNPEMPMQAAQPQQQPQMQMPQAKPGADPFSQMQAANNQSAQAQKQYYDEAKRAQDEYNSRLIEVDNVKAKELAAIDNHQASLMDAIMNQKIDPNRVWNNAGTGAKISAGIGVLLSGLGAGLTGGPNLALESINKMVDKDIDAQKTELGKKQTLFSMNMQKYRDVSMATAATKASMAAMLQGQLSSSAARMGSAQAMQNAKLQNAQIDMYRQQLNQQLASDQTSKAVMNHIGNTGDLSYAQYLPEKQRLEVQDRAVPGYGLARNKESAAKANELVASTEAGVDLINELKGFAGKSGSKFSPQDRTKAETLRRMIIGQIREGVLGPGTVNDAERAILEGIVKDPSAIFQLPKTALASLDTILSTLENKKRIGLKSHGVNVPAKLDIKPPVKGK